MYDELVKRLRHSANIAERGLITPPSELCAAADAIEEPSAICDEQKAQIILMAAEIEEKQPRWIPVTERLPEEEESVFVVRKFLGVKGQVPPSTYTEIAYRCGDRWIADSDEYKIAWHRHTDPLYWMPLPEPPKED